MPDIAMCANKTCASRMQCFRYRAIPNGDRQSWASFNPPAGADRCDRFKPIYPNGQPLRPEGELE